MNGLIEILPEAKIKIMPDGHETTWSEFVSANDPETVADVREQLSARGIASIGGGAAPVEFVCLPSADPYETAARAAGWTTIDEGGWAGNLICHRDTLDSRAGPEFGSWRDCCEASGIVLA